MLRNFICDKKRAELTAITNEISQQRLDWTTEKAQEEAKLDEKKEEIQTILAQKEDLAQIAVDLKKQEEEIDEKLKVNRQIELSNEEKATDLENREKDLETKKQEVIDIGIKNDAKMGEFKKSVIELIKTVRNLI